MTLYEFRDLVVLVFGIFIILASGGLFSDNKKENKTD